MLYSDEEYKLFSYELEGTSIGTVWSAMRADNFEKAVMSYEEREAYFLELLHRLMQDGKIKLASRGKFLEGSVDEQIALYREKFPKNQEEMDADAFDGFWFLTEECPGGIVWIHDSGYEDWT
ncbi:MULTISPECIES: DUF596 domain-containing protein [Serratia]|uniref:DUF596 domain-containing protein n=1 Tax=Serratia TaxID=613 RepID=UPI0004E2B0C7|nr:MULTISPECIES: DUF596 domain-containing protein [Serratia]HEI8867540.1 DUF596 domain-containing protein [Serratia odorifera]KFB55441.1 hypothetical protein DH21_16555 [Serratia marcescens]MBN5335904.1 DUF596 domain-containing protein [Serratia marcescens]MBN5340293.1 DUF596 domain-containing protein [Serratia marcescens]MCW7561324.1 DUF596 domain-containing protein [Serratia marcescens]